MKLFALVPFLLALVKKADRWYIDGNNLLAHKNTAGDRDSLVQKLKEIQDTAAEEIILVFDGRKGEETSIEQEGFLRIVSLGDSLKSDEYVLDDIETLDKKSRVNLVSADRELRKKASNIKPVVKTVVNPVTFWRRYLPRMKGVKGPNDNLLPDQDS